MSDVEEDYSFDDFHEDSGEEHDVKPLKPHLKTPVAASPPKPFKSSPPKSYSPLRSNQRGFNDDDTSTVDDNVSEGVLSLGPSIKFNDSLKYPDLSKVHTRTTHNDDDFDFDEIDEEINAVEPVSIYEPVQPIRAASPIPDIPEQIQPAAEPPALPLQRQMEVETIEDKAETIMSPVTQRHKQINYDIKDTVAEVVQEEISMMIDEPQSLSAGEPSIEDHSFAINPSVDSGKGSFDASKLQSVKMKAANMRKRNGSDDAAESVPIVETPAIPAAPVDTNMSHPVAGKWTPVHKKVAPSSAGANSVTNPIKSIVSPLAKRKQAPTHDVVVQNSVTAGTATIITAGRNVKSIKDSIQNELTQLGLDALSPVHKKPNTNTNNTDHSHVGNKQYNRRVASTGTTPTITKAPARSIPVGTTSVIADSSTPNGAAPATNSVKPYNQKYEQIKKLRSEHANQKPVLSDPVPETVRSPTDKPIDSSIVTSSAHPTFSNPGPTNTNPSTNVSSTHKYRPSPVEVQNNRRISLKPALPARKARPAVMPIADILTSEPLSAQPVAAATNNSILHAVLNSHNNGHMQHRKLRTPDVPHPDTHSAGVSTVVHLVPPVATSNSSHHTSNSSNIVATSSSMHSKNTHQQQQQQYQPKPPANKPSVPRQTHHPAGRIRSLLLLLIHHITALYLSIPL